MTCDERIEALLNKAGQTISDLPKGYSYDQMNDTDRNLLDYMQKLFPDDPPRNEPENYLWYILHLTDIIDRMEWALDKTLREKAYIRAKCCYICGLYDGKVNGEKSEEKCEQEDYCMELYEDWREDDA